jgi:predicted nucleic acid-binding protein
VTIEAISTGLITPGQPAKKLKQNPDVIKQLGDYAKCADEIGSLNIRVYPVTTRQIRNSEAIRSSCGMMTNDSVTAAMMSSYGITKVAALDSDLNRAPEISLYRPTDVP